MNDDVRDELRAYFASDIGRPPAGARERVLRGLSAGARVAPAATTRLRWALAVALVLLIVAALLGLRTAGLARHTRPAGPGPVPASRSGAAVGYDAARGVVVLFGGSGLDKAPLADTWARDGAGWHRLNPAQSPPAARTPLMAPDAADRVLVLIGLPDGDTWTWDGRTWRPRSAPAPPVPTAVMASDPVSGSVLLYGQAVTSGDRQTWRWDGARWTRLQPRTTPDVVAGAVLAGAGGRLVLTGAPFGFVQGQPQSQSWAWDGTDWSLLAPPVRLPLAVATVASDPAHDGAVAVLGTETWVWDGSTWSRVHPAHQPPARTGGAMAYDGRSRQVLLYGGLTGGSTVLGDVWAWDGSDWKPLEETKR